jgi:hypothetical protein
MSLKDQVVDFINTPTGKYIAAGAATLLGASAVAALLTKKPEPWPVNGAYMLVFVVLLQHSELGICLEVCSCFTQDFVLTGL